MPILRPSAPLLLALHALLALACLMLLAGCAGGIRSQVSAINQLPADVAGKSYFIGLYQGQQASLEQQHYAALIGAELNARQLRPAASLDGADLMVYFRVAAEQRTELVPTPLFGPTGFQAGGAMVMVNGASVYIPTYTVPTYGVTGMGALPALVDRHTFGLDILDRASTVDKPLKLYEATVYSETYSPASLQVVPGMIKALFLRWPGPPTRVETVDLPASRPTQ